MEKVENLDENINLRASIPIEEIRYVIRTVMKEEFGSGTEKFSDNTLMTAKEVCEFLQISRSTLNRWKEESIIPCRKLGKRVYFLREELLAAMQEGNHFQKMQSLKNNQNIKR